MNSPTPPKLEPGPLGNIVKVLLLLVIGSMWAVIGLAFWIAVLARVCALFSAALVYSVFTREGIGAVSRQLDAAISLYPYGFRVIAHQMRTTPSDDESQRHVSAGSLWKLALELCWVALFWGAFLYMLEQYGALPPVISPLLSHWFSGKK